jgi:hypothetical protein
MCSITVQAVHQDCDHQSGTPAAAVASLQQTFLKKKHFFLSFADSISIPFSFYALDEHENTLVK